MWHLKPRTRVIILYFLSRLSPTHITFLPGSASTSYDVSADCASLGRDDKCAADADCRAASQKLKCGKFAKCV